MKTLCRGFPFTKEKKGTKWWKSIEGKDHFSQPAGSAPPIAQDNLFDSKIKVY